MQDVAQRHDRQSEHEVDDLCLLHVVFVFDAGEPDEDDQDQYRDEDRMEQGEVDLAPELYGSEVDPDGKGQQKYL